MLPRPAEVDQSWVYKILLLGYHVMDMQWLQKIPKGIFSMCYVPYSLLVIETTVSLVNSLGWQIMKLYKSWKLGKNDNDKYLCPPPSPPLNAFEFTETSSGIRFKRITVVVQKPLQRCHA
jgi:hypothetical protein